MTYKQIQDRAMGRLGLTTTAARDRIKLEINERYREIQASLNLQQTRFGTVNVTVTSGEPTSTVTGIAKLGTLYDPTTLKRALTERPMAFMRQRDPNSDATGTPEEYAIFKHEDDELTLLWYPKPNQDATLKIDGLLAGTDLSADSDVPSIPVDFHNAILFGVLADEYDILEKGALSAKYEGKYEARVKDLRLFLRKSIYLSRQQTDISGQVVGMGRKVWPYANFV